MSVNVSDYAAQVEAPLAVQCPRRECGQGRGWPCKTTGSYQGRTHAARRALVASWSPQERADAVRKLREEQEGRRAQVVEQLGRLRDDPAVQESQRRTREAWDRTNAEVRAAAVDCSHVGFHPQGCRCRWLVERAKPLGSFRGPAPVADLAAARRRKALRVVPGGDTA